MHDFYALYKTRVATIPAFPVCPVI